MQVISFEGFENLRYVFGVFLNGGRDDDDVVEVREASLSQEWRETELINLWKIVGAVANPIGITLYSKSPKGVLKAVNHSFPSFTRMLAKPERTSNLVKIAAFPNRPSIS